MRKVEYLPVKEWADRDGRNARWAQRKARELGLGCKIWRSRLITSEEWELIKIDRRKKK